MESLCCPGSSKRAKAPSHITQVANCLVDGCNVDLSLCRDYHKRHKVCETHSKTSRVTIGGREQRFCQQCSRFHSLVEFDERKRSCRKRLDGHNRRRRKPQLDSLPRNSGLLFSTQPGTRLLSFSATPQILPSAADISSWTGIVKPENNMALYNNNYYIKSQNSFTESSSHHNSYRDVNLNQLQFMQGLDPDDARRTTSKQLFCGGLNQVVDSDRALSLLSSAPDPTTPTREFGLNHVTVQPVEPIPPQAVHDLHHNCLSHYSYTTTQESKMNVNAVESHDSNVSILCFPEMFHQGHDGSSSSGSHQTLTFTWE